MSSAPNENGGESSQGRSTAQGSRGGTRFWMIGGFLGAGKTTAILRLAQRYAAEGRRVGIIANDLGQGLVDTQTYLAHGLQVEEMSGVCFACRFDELVAAAGRLQDGHHPDVLLAEPAGSCTDLVSRVIGPLKSAYAERFAVAPYVTLLDPQRAHTALTGKGPAGLSAKVTYLYKMQQNEADVVAINKADMLSPKHRETLSELVARNFPRAEVMLISARTGEGFDRLAGLLDGGAMSGRNAIGAGEYDSGVCAEGEARLAWLSATWSVTADRGLDADEFLLALGGAIQSQLSALDAEPAHVKMIVRSVEGGEYAIANLVSSDRPPALSHASGARMAEARLVVNGRVEVDAAQLREQVDRAVDRAAARHRADATCLTIHERAPGVSSASCPTDVASGKGGCCVRG